MWILDCRKAFLNRLGHGDQISPGMTKGDASDAINQAKQSGATNSSGGIASNSSGDGNVQSGNGSSGAAQE